MDPATRRRGRPRNPVAREERRQQILAGARRCFMEKGFHAASTAEISEAAGVSVANLYQYFPSKQELILAIAEQDLETDLDLGEVLHEMPSLLDGLGAFFGALAEAATQHDAFRLRLEILTEAQRTPQILAALTAMDAQLTEALAALIVQAQERGEIAQALDASAVAALILRIADGLYIGVGAGFVKRSSLVRCLDQLLRTGLTDHSRA